MERLDKFLVACGVGSRSEVKAILKTGAVTVDGVIQRDHSAKVDTEAQIICLNGQPLQGRRTVVVMLNKPAGYITATRDDKEKTVMELLPPELLRQDLKPVGRLDKETEGLLLFTNDGDLLHRLISPKKEVEKVYFARHLGQATQEDVKAFSDGIRLKDGTLCLPAKLEPLAEGESRITVCEGKYHQVRRMMASRGMTVTYLQRISEGGLTLDGLALGKTRYLTEKEMVHLTGNFK